MLARRGTANNTPARARNVESLANITPSDIEFLDQESFLEYIDTLAAQLSKQAVRAGEPLLAYLTSMASQEAKNRRNHIRAQREKSAA